MTKKQDLMLELLKNLSQEVQCENIRSLRKGVMTDLGLVNQFKKHDFIPNKWFQWVDRAGAPIMIIGQDWGPYVALKKFVDDYEIESKTPEFKYEDFLFKAFSSRTEKFIMKAIEQTYTEAYGHFDRSVYDKFIFTMAVLFTRQGKHFRGSHNFDEKKSFEVSYPYLARQIEIVQPKVVMTTGGLSFKAVNRYFNLGYDNRTITSVINELQEDVIKTTRPFETIIIPNFHPASHTSPKLQMEIWGKIWNQL